MKRKSRKGDLPGSPASRTSFESFSVFKQERYQQELLIEAICHQTMFKLQMHPFKWIKTFSFFLVFLRQETAEISTRSTRVSRYFFHGPLPPQGGRKEKNTPPPAIFQCSMSRMVPPTSISVSWFWYLFLLLISTSIHLLSQSVINQCLLLL